MPDDLPPLQSQPDSTTIPDDVMQQMQHSSKWAGTFGGSDTNISQRSRHNQDITAYADALNEQRAQAQEHLIQTNKVAQDLFIRTQQLEFQHQKTAADMALKQAQIQAQNARMMATTHADLLKAKHDQLTASETAGLSQHMSEIMDRSKPGDEDYNQGVIRGILAFPNADKGLQAHLLKNAGVQISPDEVLDQVKSLREQDPDAHITINSKGQATVFSRPEKAKGVSPVFQLQDALAASQPVYGVADDKGRNFNATKTGKDDQTHVQVTYIPPGAKKPVTEVFPRGVFDSMVAESSARKTPNGASQDTPAPATPAPAAERFATNPKTGEKVVFRGGQWQPLK